MTGQEAQPSYWLAAEKAWQDTGFVPVATYAGIRAGESLVASGRSNTGTGAALFISPTTASVHIANILPKLGAADRYAAATLARRLGTAPESGQPRP